MLARAPAELIPTRVMFDRITEERKIITIPLAMDPAAENRKIYEKRVPVISPWPNILRNTRRIVSFDLKTSSETRTGRLASPSLKKGKGFGIRYSTVEKKIQKAAKRATVSRV